MSRGAIRRGCAVAAILYLLIAVGFYLIAGEQLSVRTGQTDMPTAASSTGELTAGMEVRQRFSVDADKLLGISLVTATYDRINTPRLSVRVVDTQGNEVGYLEAEAGSLNNGLSELWFPVPAELIPNEPYELVVAVPEGESGNTIALMYGNTITLSHREVPLEISPAERMQVNGYVQEGKLCACLTMQKTLWAGQYYWHFAAVFALLLAAYGAYTLYKEKQGQANTVLRVAGAFHQYKFLIKQLVARDFKAKYKRSTLGVLWSFLNPLLSMAVQYIVFSTIFKSDIPNFALYLLIGIVCYNFFTEATTMALQSIVGNAGLITKVYVPKYIYPLSRVLSSGINLLLSLIPLFIVMLLTGCRPRPSLLLIPFGLICLMLFSLGVGMLLATLMVFFRDTQFLWGVMSMLWMYLTPIIYPESIIPAQIMPLIKCNPLYHIIRFIRIIMMEGVSPEPKAYLLCLIVSVLPFLFGTAVFKKEQDKFVLNL